MLKTAHDPKTGERTITFSLPAGDSAVSVVGNFNDWTPGVHVLTGRGATRSASVVVPAEYVAVFRYLGEGGHWFDEPEASYVDAGASVLVPPAEAAPAKPAARRTVKKAQESAPATKATPTATMAAATPEPAKAEAKPRAARKPAVGKASK